MVTLTSSKIIIKKWESSVIFSIERLTFSFLVLKGLREETTGEEWKFHTAFIGTLDNELA
jgi:hypothetical protein